MNIEKLTQLGFNKAVKACNRHHAAISRKQMIPKHLELLGQCKEVADGLWRENKNGEREAFNSIPKSSPVSAIPA